MFTSGASPPCSPFLQTSYNDSYNNICELRALETIFFMNKRKSSIRVQHSKVKNQVIDFKGS